MSSRTPQECVDLALDDAADTDDREYAIHELKLANECDELAHLATNADVESQFRRQALRSLASSQCDSTLERLVEGDSLDSELRSEAEELLEGIDD